LTDADDVWEDIDDADGWNDVRTRYDLVWWNKNCLSDYTDGSFSL